MSMYVDLSNPKIFHNGRDKYGNGIYHIPPDLPSIDAVQVIRCKECKYYKENTLVCGRYGLEDDDYCSWAERRE